MGFANIGYPTKFHKRRKFSKPDHLRITYSNSHDSTKKLNGKRQYFAENDQPSKLDDANFIHKSAQNKLTLNNLPLELLQKIFVLTKLDTNLLLVNKHFHDCLHITFPKYNKDWGRNDPTNSHLPLPFIQNNNILEWSIKENFTYQYMGFHFINVDSIPNFDIFMYMILNYLRMDQKKEISDSKEYIHFQNVKMKYHGFVSNDIINHLTRAIDKLDNKLSVNDPDYVTDYTVEQRNFDLQILFGGVGKGKPLDIPIDNLENIINKPSLPYFLLSERIVPFFFKFPNLILNLIDNFNIMHIDLLIEYVIDWFFQHQIINMQLENYNLYSLDQLLETMNILIGYNDSTTDDTQNNENQRNVSENSLQTTIGNNDNNTSSDSILEDNTITINSNNASQTATHFHLRNTHLEQILNGLFLGKNNFNDNVTIWFKALNYSKPNKIKKLNQERKLEKVSNLKIKFIKKIIAKTYHNFNYNENANIEDIKESLTIWKLLRKISNIELVDIFMEHGVQLSYHD